MAPGRDNQEPADLTPASWLRFGQRNILYIGFVVLLVPFGMALDGPQPSGTPGPGGIAFAMMLYVAVSAGFFLINAGLVVFDLANGRRAAKALIGCALPVLFGIGSFVVQKFML